jgi:hypothetical protein
VLKQASGMAQSILQTDPTTNRMSIDLF